MHLYGSAELEKRILALVSSGEETVSYTEADALLRTWQRARRWNKRGRLPELEEEIAHLREQLHALASAGIERRALDEELARAEAEKRTLQQTVADARRQARREALDKLTESKRELRRLEDETIAAEEEFKRTQSALAQTPFAEGADPETVREEAAQIENRSRALLAASEKKLPPRLLWPVPALAALICLVLALLQRPLGTVGICLLAACAVLALASVGLVLLRNRACKQAQSASRQREELLSRCGVQDEEALWALAEEYARLCEAREHSARQLEEKRRARDEAAEGQKTLDAEILASLDFSEGQGKAAAAQRDLIEVQERISALREKQARLEGNLENLGDPMVMRSELKTLEDRRDTLQRQYEALEEAAQTLAETNAELQTRFSPRLGRRAGELFSRLTDGRYESLGVDRDFSAIVRPAGDAARHEAAFLSAGALDQMYLALRLAICELALPEEDPCPIVLDDALASFDDERMALSLSLLRKLADTRQILLFSCHSREQAWLEGQR